VKSSELKALTVDELQEKLEQTIKSLYQLRLRATTKELEKPSDITASRRDIARIKQAIGDKQREAQAAAK
jgi:large subunit ribosomal protein L29